MASRFTPGPWRWQRDLLVTAAEGWKNNWIVKVTSWGWEPLQAPDAHLIAAAPDLYKALEEAERYVDIPLLLDEMRAALAKARGESND